MRHCRRWLVIRSWNGRDEVMSGETQLEPACRAESDCQWTFYVISRKKAQTRLVDAQTALIIVSNQMGLWVGSVLGGR